jgi:DEAD/DEAH box helicase domain-containing protein
MPPNRIQEYIQSLTQSKPMGLEVVAHDYSSPKGGNFANITESCLPDGQALLSQLGIRRFYRHQQEAINAIRQGEHVVVGTPTASGKSLIYNFCFHERFLEDPAARAIYVFPLKALTRDQLKGFQKWSRKMGGDGPAAAIYDGDTSDYQRRKIRRDPPHVVMTNPEMLHLALLPHHEKWSTFFRGLKLVVIDEVHTYRGMFGCHMAQVLRRFRRICRFYGADPTFVLCSATIANPGHLAQQLTGLTFRTIDRNGAPRGGRHWVLMDSDAGPVQTAIGLLKAAMARNLRTIVYTQSRKLAELLTMWVQQRSGRFAEKISVYRAGLLPEERQRIESDLKSGKLTAVVSTSALELGIDIGDLDLCILVGYPGSMMAARQRSGRVGRKGQDAAVVLLAGQDSLDQYFVANPDSFFKGRAETAVVNPYNEVVLAAHLICAAAELPMESGEPWLSDPQIRSAATKCVQNGTLLHTADGLFFHSRAKRPHHKVNLRSAGDRYRLWHGKASIGEIDEFRLYRETHVGAIYLHQGETYTVQQIHRDEKRVDLLPVQVDYYTRVRTVSDVDIVGIYNTKYVKNTKIYIGKVKVTDHVTGFSRVHTRTGKILDHTALDPPPSIFTTDSIWFDINDGQCAQITARGYDLLGTLHAVEHAVIGIMPLIILADRNDLGGLAAPFHPQTGSAVIFIYDGIPGGAGLSRHAYHQAGPLIENAIDVIARCKCETGCPACIHSPKCGSGNQPMDKNGAQHLLESMYRQDATRHRAKQIKPVRSATPPCVPEPQKTDLHFGVFDLETQRSAEQVGGWHMAHHMRVSCGVVYDVAMNRYTAYMEHQVDRLIEHLQCFDAVIGFNTKRFDYKVLSRYSDFDFAKLPTVDLLDSVFRQLGFRLSLDHLAKHTLNLQKSGSGLDALEWWKSGEVEKLVEYCRMDVQITLELYLYLRNHGYVIYQQKNGERYRIPISL